MLSTFGSWRDLLARLGLKPPKRRSAVHRRLLVRPLRLEPLEDRHLLAAVAVTTTADVMDGSVTSVSALIANPGADGKISLREAVTAGNSDTTADTISFDPSIPLVNGVREILLTLANGQLNINTSLTIDASASSSVAVKGEDVTPGSHNDGEGIRIFNIIDTSAG